MYELKSCLKDAYTLCVDCDNTECVFCGQKSADCPKWKCDRPTECMYDCDHCGFIDHYIKEMRRQKNE